MAVNLRHVNGQTVDYETGEVLTLDVRRVRGEQVVTRAYDQDSADLERWFLRATARRLLMRIEDRAKRVRVPYSEFAYMTELKTRAVRSVLVRERVRLEQAFRREYIQAGREVLEGDLIAEQKRVARYRVVNCCRSKVSRTAEPEIWFSRKTDRASFHNLQVCGSVWTCPVCSRRINLARQRQVRAAYNLFLGEAARGAGGAGDAMMVTFTIKHGYGDALGELFERLKLADRGHLQKSYSYKRLTGYKRTVAGARVSVPSDLAYLGRISATEVTHGKNGWHPHLHQLWFFDRRLTPGELQRLRRDLFREWRAACVAVGLPAPVEFVNGRAVGVDVRRALSADEYLTKFGHERQWGPEREIASQHTKGGRGGRSPFQLLADYSQGDTQAGQLFRVFADVTLGRHQLEFSKGLRERLQALDYDDFLASDEALAMQDEGEDSRMLGALSDAHFEAMLAAEEAGELEPFGAVLAIAKSSGFEAARAFIESLPGYVNHVGRVVRQESFAAQEADCIRQVRLWFELLDPAAAAPFEDAAASIRYVFDQAERVQAWRLLLIQISKMR